MNQETNYTPASHQIIKACLSEILHDEDAEKLFYAYLVNKYKDRKYHSLIHIENMLYSASNLINESCGTNGSFLAAYNNPHQFVCVRSKEICCKMSSMEVKTFVLAIIFHDIIKTGETPIKDSIAEAIKVCSWFGIEHDWRILKHFISFTDHESQPMNDVNIDDFIGMKKWTDIPGINMAPENIIWYSLIIHDVDLFIFTKSFHDYCENVYEIYQDTKLPKSVFVEKRIAFLKELTKRKNIFVFKSFPYLEDAEAEARENIRKELSLYESDISIFF